MVDYQGFISTVAEHAHAPAEEAERAACATLQTLAERLTAGETEDVAERLPAELRACLEGAGAFEPFHVDEFLRRVEERAGLDRSHAERDARAVFVALWRAVGPDEFDDLRAELPNDFEPLLGDALREPAPPPAAGTEATVSFDEFIGRVAERAGLDSARARRAAEAVLEVLAYRITAGEVEDLERRLPAELQPALERGKDERRPARPLSLDTFLAMVADREGVDRGQAAEHARAVLDVLREAVGEGEFHDVTEQLSGEYQVLLRRG
jgi:uncharacterized protein (DUF2267 family)